MYTPPIRHRTPNVVEGVALSGISDYVPAGVTQAWEQIKGQVTGVTGSTAFGYVAIGLGAVLIWATLASVGGKGKYRGKR